MDWYLDSQACLDVAKQQLKQIEAQQIAAMLDGNILPYLKVSIKNCLENCRSPLDYVANFIFDKYCKHNYTSNQLRKMKVYFPIRNTKSLFDVCMRENFRGLTDQNLINVFESAQPIHTSWLSNLSSLINENKHRNLTKQEIINKSIIHGSLGGNYFDGVTFEGNGNDLGIGDKIYDGVEMLQVFENSKGSFSRDYLFEVLNVPVIDTLTLIRDGSSKLTEDFKNLLS